MSARAHAVVHHARKGPVPGALENASAEFLVGMPALQLCAPAPIRHVVGQAAIAPECAVLHGAVGEQAAAVARKVMKLRRGRAAGGHEQRK